MHFCRYRGLSDERSEEFRRYRKNSKTSVKELSMTKPRIYFLVNSLEGGGAERVITNISTKLIEDFDIDIITLKPGVFYPLPSWVNHIPLSNIRGNFFMMLAFPSLLLQFKKHFKEHHYTNGVSFLELANFIHILTRKDAIISFRTSIGVFKWLIWMIYKFLIRRLYPRAKTIIVNSEENKYELAEYLGIPLAKIETIYNPIDLGNISELKTETVDNSILGQIAWKKVFITVSRLVADDAIGSKNHSLVLRIMKRLVDSGEKDIIYLIVWDGPARGNLEDQVKKDGLEKYVIFTGKQQNVFKFLARADYVIYASRHEWFPNVLIEAMALGVPIITSNFKTWAYEVIFWEFKKEQPTQYPSYGPNGVILEFGKFEEQFFEIYPKLERVEQWQVWLENFTHSGEQFAKILIG